MTVVEHLKSLGFTNAEEAGNGDGRTVYRIRTSKGWAYERFTTVEEVDAWARGKQPG